jgi:hypothetical protein
LAQQRSVEFANPRVVVHAHHGKSFHWEDCPFSLA